MAEILAPFFTMKCLSVKKKKLENNYKRMNKLI